MDKMGDVEMLGALAHLEARPVEVGLSPIDLAVLREAGYTNDDATLTDAGRRRLRQLRRDT